jgi:hypothetical protein
MTDLTATAREAAAVALRRCGRDSGKAAAATQRVIVGDDDLHLGNLRQHVLWHEMTHTESLGSSTRSRSRIVIPSVMIRKQRENSAEFGERTAFTVCHAISIAMLQGVKELPGDVATAINEHEI